LKISYIYSEKYTIHNSMIVQWFYCCR